MDDKMTQRIKSRIREIADNGFGMVYDDVGSGCAGPGYADPDTLIRMLEAGDFDNAEIVKLEEDRAEEAFGMVGLDYWAGANYLQLEFAGIVDTGYCQVFWIWWDRDNLPCRNDPVLELTKGECWITAHGYVTRYTCAACGLYQEKDADIIGRLPEMIFCRDCGQRYRPLAWCATDENAMLRDAIEGRR